MTVFVNEFHYSNIGRDIGEGFEIAGPAGTDLSGWSIVVYRGRQAEVRETIELSGVLGDDANGYGLAVFVPAMDLPQGRFTSFALVDDGGAVVEYLSIGGRATAVEGPALGMTSTDIGVTEDRFAPVGLSLQRIGVGTEAADFAFAEAQPETFGAVNQGQTFEADPVDPIDPVEPPSSTGFTLELLHFADQEANAATIGNIDNLSGVLNALRDEDVGADGTLTLSSGDAIIPGLFFDASQAVFGSQGIADIQIQNELEVQAIALGNHEFDLGPALLAGLIDGSAPGDFSALTTGTELDGQDFAGADFPYLSTNLDFSTEASLAPLAVSGGQPPIANTVTSSVVLDAGSEKIGVVGATVPTIRSISSPGDDLGISPAWASGTPTDAELDALAVIIQAEVDTLLADDPGLNKIILASHMQQISIELALAERLTDVDIIIAGGSNTRLFDENDRIRDGDSDQGTYPAFVTNAGGTTTAVVNTDGNYKYVGRLVIEFDADGNLLADTYEADVSGAFATDDQGVSDLGAAGLIDPEIDAITDAIQAEIIATESNVFGISEVFLNGNRSGTFAPDDPDGVRTQETNLGNLTADANLAYAKTFDPSVVLSVKNGGGIRANIGQIVVPAGGSEAERLPNEGILDADGNVVKPAGGISQNDIATTLAFNNGLTLLDITKAEIKAFLEGAVAALPTGVSGGFPQISGLKFSFDETGTAQTYDADGNIAVAGARVQNAGIFDGDGNLIAEIVRDGAVVGDPNESFRLVTLNFLANSGDEILSTLSNPNRVDLIDFDADGADDDVFTGDATFSADGTEQDALAEYLDDNFSTTPFSEADAGPDTDARIQNLTFRTDSIFGDDPVDPVDPVDPTAFTLEILHVTDQEGSTAQFSDIVGTSAVLNALEGEDLGGDGVADNTIRLSSGDAFIPGVFFEASDAVFGTAGIADILIQNELGFEAIALGNHEFDVGTANLAGLIDGSATGVDQDGNDFTGTAFPYLSANLDFSTDANLAPLEVAGGQAPQGNVVTSSTIIEEGGEQIGVVGATVPTLGSISSPGDVGISPAWAGSTPTPAELDALAAIIQAEVDLLTGAGVNKVILSSHMQQISIEEELAARLSGVDVIIAGGSNTRLFDDNDVPRAGDSDQGQYPTFITNADGGFTAVVNTDGSYKYVGRLVIDFDENGNIDPASYDETVSGAYATDTAGVAALGAAGQEDPDVVEIVDLIEAEVIATEGNVFGASDVFLNGNRSGTFAADDPDGVRTQETNLGNLTADANLAYAQELADANGLTDADGNPEVVQISIKNGGGIRANIGETVVPAGGTEAVRLPNSELVDGDGNVIKPAGGISQTDIQSTLAFNNGLVLVDITRAELVEILEGGVAALPNVDGAFLQISGIKFSFDESQQAQVRDASGAVVTEGERVQNAGIFDEDDNLIAELVRDGALVGDPNETFRAVTLDFLVDFGDPNIATLNNLAAPRRVDLEAEDVMTGAAIFADDGTEQDALAEYLEENFSETPFSDADVGPDTDARIQNLTFRADEVFGDEPVDPVDPPAEETVFINEFHYSNVGRDVGEGFEVAGTAGTDLSGWSIVVYTGRNAKVRETIELEGVLGDDGSGFGFATFEPARDLPQGRFSSFALVDDAGEVVEYLSYRGKATASEGPAVGLTSTDVGVEEGRFQAVGLSLQRVGEGAQAEDFTWAEAQAETFGAVNTGQTFESDEPEEPQEVPPAPVATEELGEIGVAAVFASGVEGGSEVVVHENGRLFVTNGTQGGIDVWDIATESLERFIDLTFLPGFGGIQSVAVKNGLVAAAVSTPDVTDASGESSGQNGYIALIGADNGLVLDRVTVGNLPDMVTFNADGTKILVANEGEKNAEGGPDVDPLGGVSIIDVSNLTEPTVETLTFEAFDGTEDDLLADGVRLPDGIAASETLEPEYIAIIGDTAYVALQEANAFAVVDIASGEITDIFSAGTVDHSEVGSELDPLDDGLIGIQAFDDLRGLRMPDGISTFEIDGMGYIISANEGDGRGDDFDSPLADEERVGAILDGDVPGVSIDPSVDTTGLERLIVSTIDGDTDGDGDIDVLHAFGSRSFTIFDEDGTVVYDSGSEFERIIEDLFPERFNNDDGDTLLELDDEGEPFVDNRSDAKGPEPEAVAVGVIGEETYAFVGAERDSGVFIYNISTPASSYFVDYIPGYDNALGASTQDFVAPETIAFISAEESTSGVAQIAVAYEVTGDTVVYNLGGLPTPTPAELVITEIMQNPSAVSDSNGEWFEVYNPGSDPVDLNGYTFSDNDFDTFTVDTSLVINPGEFLVFGNNADSASNGGYTADFDYGSAWFLSNGSDEIIITDPEGTEIDRVEYDDGATFPDATGASMFLADLEADNNVGANWDTSTLPYGDGDFGTPGSGSAGAPDLQITEIWPGQEGSDLTADWFEITNEGQGTWTASSNGPLFYDDESASAADADPILGVDSIAPGESVVVVIGNAADATEFETVWSPDINLSGVQVGHTDGAGLGGGGDAVTLFLDSGADGADAADIVDSEAYPDTTGVSGQSYDVPSAQFSTVAGLDGVVETTALAGATGDEPAVGSPGLIPTPGPSLTPIFAIQGNGATGPLDGQIVTTRGIVTAAFQGANEIGAYFMQDLLGDGDATTSDGLFVFDPFNTVAVGDIITVTGSADEFFGKTQINAVTSVVIESSGNPMPSPVQIDVTDMASVDLEALEGMLVEVIDGSDGTIEVTDNFTLGRFGDIAVAPEANVQATQVLDPQTETTATIQAFTDANQTNRITIDDGNGAQNPDTIALIPDGAGGAYDVTDAPGPTLRMGAEFSSITGVLDFAFGEYAIQYDAFDNAGNYTPLPIVPGSNDRPDVPAVGGDIQVASLNVLNFFTTLDDGIGFNGNPLTLAGLEPRGADDLTSQGITPAEAEFDRQLEKLITTIEELGAEVLALQELENGGFGSGSAVVTLVDALNTSAGSDIWSFVDFTTASGSADGLIGTDAITTGIIYRSDVLTEVGNAVLVFDEFSDGASANTTFDLANVLNPVASVDDQLGDFQRNRPATAASFEDADGNAFTVASAHMKSKGDSNLEDVVLDAQAALDGGDMTITQADIDAVIADPNYDQGDGQAFWNGARAEAAEELAAWLLTDPTASGSGGTILLGDLNAYGQEEPVDKIVDAGFTHLVGGGADDFGFTFFGEQGALDHAFVTPGLSANVTGAAEWHVNADEPVFLDYNLEFNDPAFFEGDDPARGSDHDPVIIGLDFMVLGPDTLV